MIRFPNPGSDINQMISIFKILYSQLEDFSYFTIDNMAEVMTEEKVASSSGYIGDEALKRSYSIQDKSRNQLYNQAKSYSEIYRLLGWFTTSEESSSKFKFSYLGLHIIKAHNPKKLFEVCLLGIHYPNNTLNVKFSNKNKIFWSILDFISDLDNIITRDEIIFGPMNIIDGDDESEVHNKKREINNLRKSSLSQFKNLLDDLCENQDIQVNTARNYTRFVLSVLKYTGWMEDTYVRIYGKKLKGLQLTEYGIEISRKLDDFKLLLYKDLTNLDQNEITLLSKIGFINILDHADFIIENEKENLNKERLNLPQQFQQPFLFNPFQNFQYNDLSIYLPEAVDGNTNEVIKEFSLQEEKATYNLLYNKITVQPMNKNQSFENTKTLDMLSSLLDNDNIEKIADNLYIDSLNYKQDEFYPLIADLFQIIFGLDAIAPQAGVNNERHDVIVPHDKFSIPVEVKSPTEERLLSVKAVRQALENKIILLSRANYPTTHETVSLAVGYDIPRKRSDVYRLIEDVKKTYNINIAITDLKSLLTAALNCIKDNKTFDIQDFTQSYGVLEFENL